MPYPKGQKQSKEHSEKISKSLLGIKRSEEFKEKLRIRQTGKILSEEIKQKIRMNRKGKGLGNTNGLGKNLKNKSAKGKVGQEKNGNWKGGVSPKYKIKIAPRPKPLQCEVCGAIGKICYDHDHKTGEFRGWLCGRCNVALGMVKDNTGILLALVDYLNEFQRYQCNTKNIPTVKAD